jgi:hypothetical protein
VFSIVGCATTSNKQPPASTTLSTETIYRNWSNWYTASPSNYDRVTLFNEDRAKEGSEYVEIRATDTEGPFFWVQWSSASSTKKKRYEGTINTTEIAVHLDNGNTLHMRDPLSFYEKKSGANAYAAARGGQGGLLDLIMVTVGAAWKHVNRAGAFRISEEQAAQIQASNTLELECGEGKRITVMGPLLDSFKQILAKPRYTTIAANDPVVGSWKTQPQKSLRGRYAVLQVQADGAGIMQVHKKNGKLYGKLLSSMTSATLLYTAALESKYAFVFGTKLNTWVQRYTLTNNSLVPDDTKTPAYFPE